MFGLELKKVRLRLCMTQLDLARKTNIPLGTIKNWERGNYLPSAHHWKILHEFLKQKIIPTRLTELYEAEKVRKYARK